MGKIYINPYVWSMVNVPDITKQQYVNHWKDMGWNVDISHPPMVQWWQIIFSLPRLYVTHDGEYQSNCIHVIYKPEESMQARLSNKGQLEYVVADFSQIIDVLRLYS